MKYTFEVDMAKQPVDFTLAEKLAWEYYFNYCEYAVVETNEGCWIVANSNIDLKDSFVFPDEECFRVWLINYFRDDFESWPEDIVRQFVREPALITPELVDVFRGYIMGKDTESK